MGKLLGVRDMKIASIRPSFTCEVKRIAVAIHVTHNPRLAVDLQDPLNRLHRQQCSQTRNDRVCNLVRSVDWEAGTLALATAIRMKDDVKREKGE